MEPDRGTEPARVAAVRDDELDLPVFVVALLRHDAELEEQLLDLGREPLAPRRVADLDRVPTADTEDRRRSVTLQESPKKCHLECPSPPPYQLCNTFRRATHADH